MEVIVKLLFGPIAPSFVFFDFQRWYPIPRETFSSGRGKNIGGNGKIL